MTIEVGITILVFFLSLALVGYSFLAGYWHEDEKERFGILRRYSIVIDPDLVFGKVSKKVVLGADIVGFWTCVILAVPMTFEIARLALFPESPNLAGVFWIAGIGGGWISRFIFILRFRKLPPSKIRLFWPHQRL